MDLTPFLTSRKLIKCLTGNGNGEERVRFVEIENFGLWHYLVTNKHELAVWDETPCLWMSASDYAARGAAYAATGEREAVNRLVITLYDSELGYTSTIERFAPRDDSFKLLSILNDHLSHRVVGPDELESAVIPGYAVTQIHRPYHADPIATLVDRV